MNINEADWEKAINLITKASQLLKWQIKLLRAEDDPNNVGGVIMVCPEGLSGEIDLEEDDMIWNPPDTH